MNFTNLKTAWIFWRQPQKHSNMQKARLSINTIALALSIIATGSGFPHSVLAQEQEPIPEKAPVELEIIKVTAQKREESAQEVPTAITVLKGDELQDKGVGRSANEILNYVPNASAATQSHSRPRWWIRGVGAGQQQHDLANPVGFYLDEVYISNASATGFPLFDLERIEVLRGPQGTLWGKNTTGGAISVQSKKPEFGLDGVTGYTRLSYGTYRDLIIEGAAGAELKADVLAARVSFHSENQNEGRFKNKFTGKKGEELRDDAVRLQLLGKITPNLEALLNVHRREYKTDGATWTIATAPRDGIAHPRAAPGFGYTTDNNRDSLAANAPDNSDTKQNGAVFNLKWQLGELSLTSITGFEDFSLEGEDDSDRTSLELARGYSKAKSHQWSQEFRLASPKEQKVSWVTGLHWFKENIDSYSAAGRLPSAAPLGLSANYSDTKYDHSTHSIALFGSAKVKWTDRFDTTFGLRWTRETKEVDIRRRNATTGVSFSNNSRWWNTANTVFPNDDSNFAVSQDKTWNKWALDIAPEYSLSDNARVFFKYAHGVKSGGFNTSATDLDAVNVVKPETLDSYELGLKSEWLNRRLIFNATLFHYDYDDVQVNVVGPKPSAPNLSISYLQNASEAHVDGLELEVEALPSANLHIRGSLGLLKTEYDKFTIQNSTDKRDGNSFVRSPQVTALFGADYRLPVWDGANLLLSGDYRFTSRQYYYVAQQKRSQYNDRSLRNISQDPYSIVNLRASYEAASGNSTLTFYINNATDEKYTQHALPAGTFSDAEPIIQGDRRTFGVSYTARF
ncbi:MAG: TonB-dependent receptor [Azoarcus sp.]|jgi:iron complex outermembrane receptor protein|nr:TonB-dependent receptor [Azoarcus sp.]